jgi:hypothetical protein
MKTQIANHTNAYVISVPPRSDGDLLHRTIAELDGCGEREVSLMASSLRFATPREVCALRAVIEHAAANAGRVYFDCPASDDIHRYLERMDFYANLPENVSLSRQRPRQRRRDLGDRLIELLCVRDAADVDRLDGRLSEIAKGQLGPGSAANAFVTAISAAAENSVDHADSPIGALVSAQRYTASGLELAVVDLGHGIPTTLARNPDHAGLTDIEAVELALEDHVSGVTDAGRGAGLWEFIRDVRRGGDASVGIASGYADLRISWRSGVEKRNAARPSQPVPGTWIWVRLEASKGENR